MIFVPPQKHRTSLGSIVSHFFNNGPQRGSDGWAGSRDSQACIVGVLLLGHVGLNENRLVCKHCNLPSTR